MMEVKYRNAAGNERLAHSQAECVQLEHAGWKEVEGETSGAEANVPEENLRAPEPTIVEDDEADNADNDKADTK